MSEAVHDIANKVKKERAFPTVSALLADGSLVEMVCRISEERTLFCVWDGESARYEKEILDRGRRLVPYSPNNNLIRNGVVLFPSEPQEYGSEEELVAEIREFIHQYVQVSPLFEQIATYYVLLTWVYDAFGELPYLRLRGDPGSGKTRFLLTVGSLCYKPIFASGASTVSPLFRILDAVRGTLIIDEGDFRMSDEKAEIVKILNVGNAPGIPVLRSEVNRRGEINPTAYVVFGPKLVATRGFFQDRALESRCLTEEMGQYPLRDDVPINLPARYKDEALRLRNKLLFFRLRNLKKCAVAENLVDRTIEPRLAQVFTPLLSVIEDPNARAELQTLARQYHRDLVAERGMETEGRVLEIVMEMVAQDRPLGVKEITSWFIDRHGDEYDRKVTTRWIGIVLRRLGLKTRKSHGVYVIPAEERPKLARLFERYGVAEDNAPTSGVDSSGEAVSGSSG